MVEYVNLLRNHIFGRGGLPRRIKNVLRKMEVVGEAIGDIGVASDLNKIIIIGSGKFRLTTI